MKRRHAPRAGLFAAAALAVLVALMSGCSSLAERKAMESTAPVPERKADPAGDVQVAVTGGQGTGTGTGATPGAGIADEDLKAAIEASLRRSGVFTAVKSGGAAYKLNARVVDLSRPLAGFSMTVFLEMAWTLTKDSAAEPVVRKVIRSEFTAGAFDAFAGATRVRLAVEGAVRKNIDEMLVLLHAAKF